MGLAQPYGATILVNDRVDLAVLSGAGGVHLGQTDLTPSRARRIVGEGAVVGYSTHTLDQMRAALKEPVTYIAVGPVFGTATKTTGYQAIGLGLVAEAARVAASVPVVAIGGITLEAAPSVIEAGAGAVAVIGDLLASGDPAGRVRAYRRALDGGGRVPSARGQV